MGHTKLSNFQAGLYYKDNPRQEVITGCDTIKQAKEWANSDKILKVMLWAQTAYGKARIKGYDYLVFKGTGITGMVLTEK